MENTVDGFEAMHMVGQGARHVTQTSAVAVVRVETPSNPI